MAVFSIFATMSLLDLKILGVVPSRRRRTR
jgi:hypothetical protein